MAKKKVDKKKKSTKKIGSRKVNNGQETIRYSPFEDYTQLASMLEIRIGGRVIGAYILKKGEDNFKVVFGLECKGIHSTLRQEEIDQIFDTIEAGLKDIPYGEELTVAIGSFSTDAQRQRELKSVVEAAPNNETKFLIMSERSRVRELNKAGIRKPKYLRFYFSYTQEASGEKGADFLEKIIVKAEKFVRGFTGELSEIRHVRLEQLLYTSFTDGYEIWEQLFSNKMGLEVRPFIAEQLWEQLWYKFNPTASHCEPIPQLLILDEEGLREESYSEVDPTTFLMATETSIPVADRRWVNVKGDYIGVLTFIDKPGGWADKLSQLQYLWKILARDRVYDTEIVCQVQRANDGLVKTNMQRLTKQANTTTAMVAAKGGIDVASHLNIEKGVAAQRALYEGGVALHCGLVFLVHRPNLQLLDDACRYIQSLFMRPAWVGREVEYAWKIWLQTLPITWERLLTKPFSRRLLYLNSEIPGLMPLVRSRSCDTTGFELIADEGGTPITIDLYNKHRNIGLFGTTRSGKSVIAAGILTHALARGVPVVALDFPKPDGTGTFTDYTKFFGVEYGSYFDVGKESSNLFELPNLSGLPPSSQAERFDDYKDFLLEALIGMVMGSRTANTTGQEKTLNDTVRSIISLALESFFADDTIRDRYAMAYKEGLDSSAWSNIPTLEDFLGFCSLERLRLSGTADIRVALDQVKLRIRFWLASRVGKAISRPSTFKTDSQLLVFALRNLSNDDDAAILALSAYSAALRRALSSPSSIFFIDEASILFEYDAIAALIARLCANGAKSGTRVIISAQDPDTIYKSSSAAKILQNLSTKLIGRIQPIAADSFSKIFKYPPQIISKNASEAFFPKKEGVYSQWLLDDNGLFTFCRFYPGYALLAAVANNKDEQASRTKILSKYPPEERLLALNEFSKELVADIRSQK